MSRVRQLDSLQGFMSSFKQFEKKLDKLQADMSYHGNTLSELRSLVAGLSNGAASPKPEDSKRQQNKTVGLQWEAMRMRRPIPIPPMPSKLKAKSFQGQKYGSTNLSVNMPFRAPKKVTAPPVGKHHRPRKAEAPRKATMLRPQKKLDKTRNKLHN